MNDKNSKYKEIENIEAKGISVVEKPTDDLKQATLELVQAVISKEINEEDSETQQYIELLLKSFGFEIDKYLELEESITDNEKIIEKFVVSTQWEKILKNILTFLKVIQLLDKELHKDYNFSSLNKKISYHNIKTLTKDSYSQEELKMLAWISDVKKNPDVNQQINQDISWLDKQWIYKQKISEIIALLNVEKFLDQQSDLNNNSSTKAENHIFPIYNKILNHAKTEVNDRYETIRISTTQINPEYKQDKILHNIQDTKTIEWEKYEKIKKPFYKNIKYLFAAAGISLAAWFFTVWQKKESVEIKNIQTQIIMSENQRVELFNKQLEKMLQNKINSLIQKNVNIYEAKNILWLEVIEMFWVLLKRHGWQIKSIKRNYKSDSLVKGNTINVKIQNEFMLSETYNYTFNYPIIKSPLSLEQQSKRAVHILNENLNNIANNHNNLKDLMDELVSNFWFIIEEATYNSYQNYNTQVNYDYIDSKTTKVDVTFINTINWEEIQLSFTVNNIKNY